MLYIHAVYNNKLTIDTSYTEIYSNLKEITAFVVNVKQTIKQTVNQ